MKIFPVPFTLGEVENSITFSTDTATKLSKEQIIKQAIDFHLQGNTSEAAKSYKYCINQGFSTDSVFSNYAMILKDQGQLEEAKILTIKAIKINPDIANHHFLLGNILKDLGKLTEAEISIRKAIELNPNLQELHYSLGSLLIDLGNLQEAELSTRKAIELNPNCTEAYANLGSILKDLGNLQEAELSTRKAIKLKPDFSEAYSNLGSILIERGNLKEAEIFLRTALQLNPDLEIANSNLGGILIERGNLKEAEILVRKAIKLNPDSADAHSNLGSIFTNLGNLKEAEISTKKAIKLNPKKALYHIKLGRILNDLGQIEEANVHELKAVKCNTMSPLLNTYRENAQIINKTAFLIYNYTIFNHFKSILEINTSSFEILVPDDINNKFIQEICNKFKIKGVKVRKTNEVISKNLIYKKLVSIHGDREIEYIKIKNNVQTKIIVPFIKLLGKQNIRFMYTAGKDKYTINSYWNKYYDGILCFGPYHADKLKKKHNTPTAQMGYPRFDKYFKPGFDKDLLLEKFKCDPKKKTIVWLPTWTNLSSIDKYHKVISSLRIEHNIVVRPHPSMKNSDPESYKKLFSVDFNYVDDDDNDNVRLYALADLMLFDYGGPMFGSLYLNKNFAFLEMNLKAKNNIYLGKISSEDYLKSFFPDRIAKLENLKSICNYCLKNPPSNSILKSLREEFFNTNYQGNSSERAYELLTADSWLI